MIAAIAIGLGIYSRTVHVPITADLREGVTIASQMPWNELVASWTTSHGDTSTYRIEAQPSDSSKWYTLGVWSADPLMRYSVKDQKDELADVQTDTLVLRQPVSDVRIRVTGGQLQSLTLSFANRSVTPASRPVEAAGWGKTLLDVPQRCQGDYPNGKVICSPTATSMILAYWAATLKQPILDEGVEKVCTGVFDPNWPGTGNWPFNTAYAGSLPGMRAFVARLWHIGHLEDFLRAGFPIACSISYDLLRGKGKKGMNDGHLVVLVGVNSDGDPIFNDPGRREVRQVYKRADFESAWASSGRTAYIIHPRLMALPNSADQVW